MIAQDHHGILAKVALQAGAFIDVDREPLVVVIADAAIEQLRMLADRAGFAVAQPASLPEAMRVLGGSLRLIDGMIPERLEILGNAVRVVYRTGLGELLLSQELQDGTVRFTLIAPRGFPADSLERLRGRVRE